MRASADAMKLWQLQWKDSDDGTFGIHLPDNALSRASRSSGINPRKMREEFSRDGRDHICFQLISPDHNSIIKTRVQTIADLQLWQQPIFSERAMHLLCDLGCGVDEFFACRFDANPGNFYMHLPREWFDIVDIEKSLFAAMLPAPPPLPPLPFLIESLVTKELPDRLPPCFRASVPGHLQIFSEVFTTDIFRTGWEAAGFTGAKFRPLFTTS
jgi:hypothetical protein